MLIEFSGIDGSGKSSLMDRTMRLFNANSVPCYQRSLRSTYKRIAADLAAVEGHDHWKGLFAASEIEMANAFEMISLAQAQIGLLNLDLQVVVTDTYACRWLASAALWGAPNLHALSRVYSTLPAPDLSIRLDVPTETARDRINARPKGDHVIKMRDRGVLDQYAEAFDRSRELLPYRQVVIRADDTEGETWSRVEAAVRATAKSLKLHEPIWETSTS